METHQEQKKSGFAALVGRPNVGKSTLMNHLIGQKIAITSEKPQTTRNRIQTVYTDERGQIMFLDTPGVHKAKNRLGDYMVDVAMGTLTEADVVLWLVEPTTFIGAGEREIASKLRQSRGNSKILVINKTDTVKKETLLPCIEAYRGTCEFQEIVPVSAMKGTNLDTLLDVIYRYLPFGPMYYDEDTVTDIPMRQIAAELIREKALRLLRDEIPHGIAVEIEKMRERPVSAETAAAKRAGQIAARQTMDTGYVMDIEATIICERDSHKGIIIGKNGAMLKKIGSVARCEIEAMLEMPVNMQLWVKVRREWRDNDTLLRNYGYYKQ